MNRFVQVGDAEELSRMDLSGALPAMDPAELVRHAPDSHWLLLSEEGEVGARCSLWWRKTPPYRGHLVGLIGHYAALDRQSAGELLRHACDQLFSKGCTVAIGPMDGSTWRRYRFITERGSEPVFFLEPNHPDDWPEHFREAGFTTLASYSSALNSHLGFEDPRVSRVEQRLSMSGVRIASPDLERFEEHLQRIYRLSTTSFRSNFLYQLIPEQEFMGQYRQIMPYLNPELVLLAEDEGHLVGFLFALPELLQGRRGEVMDTAIIKTLAVLPGRAYAGLGSLLAARFHKKAQELGFRRVIHALMHDSNPSCNLSSHYARTIRRYALFGKKL